MRIVRFEAANSIRYGIVEGDNIHTLKESPFTNSEFKFDNTTYPLSDTKLAAPCEPSKLVCLGLNYQPHAQEVKLNLPSRPLIFLKPSTSVIGTDNDIVLPLDWRRVDYEGELGVVMGKRGRFIKEENVSEYILGYTCVNDVTERTAQKDDVQWTRAKSYDTFAPVGPWIETDIDPSNLMLETYLNGELKQSASTAELIFKIPELISYISEIMTLLPGDIISTGTPAGISGMKPGDVVEVKIEKLGTLRNKVTPSQG
jgi:2-keto-4-pentenoate hydratase/2-oxohepta-3-ene-1,7-dioic acid hydratase in catechol pathway